MKHRKTLLAPLVISGVVFATVPFTSAAPASAVTGIICPDDGCGGGGGGFGGGGGTGGTGGTVPATCSSGYISNTNANSVWVDAGVAANDVAAGLDGSLWDITGKPGVTGTATRLSPTFASFNLPATIGGKRIAVDAQGNPWVVDFNGHIWHLVNGAFQELTTGLARDIAVAPSGTVWVIGTNSQNNSFEVWSYTGSTWTANAGSGVEIDVAANGDPVVTGADGKVWIMNGGPDSGWSQIGNVPSTFSVGLSKCSPTTQAQVSGSAMWMAANPITSGGRLLFSFGGVNSSGSTLTGPYTTTTSGPIVQNFLNPEFQVTASHVAVDTLGRAWVVADPGNCDCPGEILERPNN